MPSSGPLKLQTDNGMTLEATFELSTVPVFEIVYHHKAGARGSARSVNVDYHAGLELLLTRLANLRMTILGIAVDSGIAHELEPVDRELALDFPILLNARSDFHELRLAITRAQKPVARRANAKIDGGNDQKRIRITLTADDPRLTYAKLRHLLQEGQRT